MTGHPGGAPPIAKTVSRRTYYHAACRSWHLTSRPA